MATISPDLSGIVDGAIGDAADWTTPMNTIISEINGNLDNANIKSGANISTAKLAAPAWSTWTPNYGGTGSLTFGTVTTTKGAYLQIGKLVFFVLSAIGTTGGTTSTGITFTLPVTAKTATTDSYGGGAVTYDAGFLGGFWYTSSATVAIVSKYNLANWAIAAGKEIIVSGTYDAA